MLVMGWTRENWRSEEDAPLFATLCWAQLAKEQHLALENMCFNEYTWNKFVKCECMDKSEEVCEILKTELALEYVTTNRVCQLEVTDTLSTDHLKDIEGTFAHYCPYFCGQCYLPEVTTQEP